VARQAQLPLYFVVPLDARTEQHARQWSRSGELSGKWNAIRVLSKFQNPENIEILKSMLTDTTSRELGEGRTRSRFFPLRAEVAEALRKWNVPVQPELEDGFASYSPVSWKKPIACLIGFFAFVAIIFCAKPFRRVRRYFVPTMSIILIACAAGAWERSLTHVDECVAELSGQHHVISFTGKLRYTCSTPWSNGCNLVVGSFPTDMAATIDPLVGMTRQYNFELIRRELEIIHLSDGPAPHQFEQDRNTTSTWARNGLVISHGACFDPTGAQRTSVTTQLNYGWIVFASALPLLALILRSVVRRIRRRLRARRRLCVNCGYDLRGSAGACPECGTGQVERGALNVKMGA
jgi:hypothetical protein